MIRNLLILVSVLFLSFSLKAQYNSIVSQDGTGNFSTVQAAINAAPTNSVTPYVIFIAKGKYYEKINIPSNKPNIQLIGESVASVVLTYDDYAGKPITGGGTLGTQNSASVTINASDFVAVNITFENGFKYDSAAAAGVSGTQAVAVVVNADRVAFKNCRFIGMQDTLYTKGSGNPRHYFYKCYIDGIVDFIFGSSIAIFDSCVVYPKSRTGTGNSYLTAANTTTGQSYGYWFKDCQIPNNTGSTLFYLGRPWNNATGGVTAANKTVLTNCKMSSSINPLGWSIWDAGTDTSVITYAEYQSKKFDGNLIDVSKRVSWSKQLTNTDTVGYNILNVFNGWNPCSVRTDFCNYYQTELAVSNFKGIKNSSNTNFSWNISWPVTGVTYNLYRSIDNKASFQVINTTTSNNDTSINFSAQDPLPPTCTKYYYVVEALKSGYTTTKTDTIEVSTLATLVTNTTAISNLIQDTATAGIAQTFTLSGINLLSNVTLTPPQNFEISIDNVNWISNPATLTLVPVSGSITNTIVYVRLKSATSGAYSGFIDITTVCNTLNISKQIALSGNKQNTALLVFNTIQQWDLTVNNLDNPSVRATGLIATTPTLNRLNLSNGTQVAAVPAYSNLYGQAIAPSNAGDGMWTTASGGSGGNLNRTLYEQFTIKPDVNYTVRIDSLLGLIGYYGSTSNTKIAVAYSKSNFITDSSNVTGGRDLSGVTFPGNANGAFSTPIVVASNSNVGNNSLYAFALNGNTGVIVNAGEILTIRIYFSCGSTSAGRYAVVKNVQAKGLVSQNLPLKFVNYSVEIVDNKTVLNKWLTANETSVSSFNIKRSYDRNNFVKIAELKAKNLSINKYEFSDTYLSPASKIYYQIEAVDFDGRKTNSIVKEVTINKSQNFIKIFPNPATSIVNIEFDNAKQVSIKDYLGRTVFTSATYNNKLVVDTKAFAKGVYFVQLVTIQNDVFSEKLIIQ